MSGENGCSRSAEEVEKTLIETTPALKPVLIKASLIALITVLSVGALYVGLGDAYTELYLGIGIVGMLLILRYVLQLFILRQTTYRVTSDNIYREYSLLYKNEQKVLPLKQLRGYKMTQTQIEALLGFGTIRFLTTGTGRGVGFVSFDHVGRPSNIGEEVLKYTKNE